MVRGQIDEDVRRFILTSIASVPHLEAMLLLQARPEHSWEARAVASRLYMPEGAAKALLADLCASGIVAETGMNPSTYRFDPSSGELRGLIARLTTTYSENLVAVADLIHSKTGRKAQAFADAFKLRKDS